MGVDEQVAAVPPVLEEAIEVALAEPVALGLRHRFPAPVLMALERHGGSAHRPPARRTDGEAEVQIGVAIELEASIEPAHRSERLPANGQAIGLNGIHLPGWRLLELPSIRARDAPRTGDADRRILERGKQR